MGFNSFKKDLEAKKAQAQTINELETAKRTLSKKRDVYLEEAKAAYKNKNELEYKSKVALLKNVMFNLAQTQEMLTNFTIAKDIYEMQKLNKNFVKSFDSVMKKVNATCKHINVSKSQKTFTKGLYKSSTVNMELKQMLQENNVAFSSVVNSISDISDEEIKELVGGEIVNDSESIDLSLNDLEKEFLGGAPEQEKKEIIREGSVDLNNYRPKKPEQKEEKKEYKPENIYAPKPEVKKVEKEEDKESTPEDAVLEGDEAKIEYEFKWDDIPTISFDDIAGLDDVKELIVSKVIIPLKNPELLEGYETQGGGGLCLYGPPGTGKSMFASALAHEINAKFCDIKPSDVLRQGIGNSEKAIKQLFKEARSFECAVIFFDEMDSIAPKRTQSTAARQLRSEFLSQLQGVESYKENKKNILMVCCATNKPWDIDSAFLRPGRFGTRVYVGLPDDAAREYMITHALDKIANKGIVAIKDVDVTSLVNATNGFNGSDVNNLIEITKDISRNRAITTGEKVITGLDFEEALTKVHSSVQVDDIVKLQSWKGENDA